MVTHEKQTVVEDRHPAPPPPVKGWMWAIKCPSLQENINDEKNNPLISF